MWNPTLRPDCFWMRCQASAAYFVHVVLCFFFFLNGLDWRMDHPCCMYFDVFWRSVCTNSPSLACGAIHWIHWCFPLVWTMGTIWGVPWTGGTPKMDGLQRKKALKWIIWGYPYFRKPPFEAVPKSPKVVDIMLKGICYNMLQPV